MPTHHDPDGQAIEALHRRDVEASKTGDIPGLAILGCLRHLLLEISIRIALCPALLVVACLDTGDLPLGVVVCYDSQKSAERLVFLLLDC